MGVYFSGNALGGITALALTDSVPMPAAITVLPILLLVRLRRLQM